MVSYPSELTQDYIWSLESRKVVIIVIIMAKKKMDSAEEYATSGAFTTIFGNAVGRVLDQAMFVGNLEQTIPMLAESTNLSYKTVRKAVKRLEKVRLVTSTRKIGNVQAYRFNVENELHGLLSWAEEFQLTRED